eukprot:7086561-Alexandrium_andersonii.AAC.1
MELSPAELCFAHGRRRGHGLPHSPGPPPAPLGRRRFSGASALPALNAPALPLSLPSRSRRRQT